jgi:hypothetical protein
MSDEEQKKAPGGQANGANKGGNKNAPNLDNPAENASENHDDRPDYSSRHHGQDETPGDDSKSLLVDPLEERLQPFYGVDDCGHIADWNNEAALIGCAFLDPVLVMSALENIGLENPVDLFGDKRHRTIFRIARGISNRNGALDLITFHAALKTEVNAKREKTGVVKVEYVSRLMEMSPSPSNWSYYLETVLDRYKARRKRQLMQRQYTLETENPNGAGDVNESIDDTIAELEKIRSVGHAVGHGTFVRSYELKTFSQMAAYNSPPGAMILGNCHIMKGAISIIAGHAGIGKSRAALVLAVNGAMGEPDWMGFQIHRPFKTLIIQNENGSFRLKDEATAIMERNPGFNFDEWIKVSLPPEEGLLISDPIFQATVRADIKEHQPDLIVLDPWTAAVLDDKRKDYQEALRYMRQIVPPKDDSPALLVVAHCKKPQGQNRSTGRDLLHDIAGSFVLGAAARSAFVMEAGSTDPTDDTVIITDVKCNDGKQIGASAWKRYTGYFERDSEFNFETWADALSGKSKRQEAQNADDMRAFEMLTALGNGDPVGVNEWLKACQGRGFYKSKPTLYNAIERLMKSNMVGQDSQNGKYYPMHPDGTFSKD